MRPICLCILGGRGGGGERAGKVFHSICSMSD